MHLKSRLDQTINIPGFDKTFNFVSGETIHTENSYKYDKAKVETLATISGFKVEKIFSDQYNWYDLVLLSPS